MNNELNAQELGVIALDEAQLETIEGGNPLGWLVVGYVAGEVINGVFDGIRRPCPNH